MKCKSLQALLLHSVVLVVLFSSNISWSQTTFKVEPGVGIALFVKSDQAKAASDLGFGESLPQSISLKEYCPPAGHQGYDYSTCTGWSVAYGAHTMLFAIKNNQKPPNVIFDPMFLFNAVKGDRQPLCDTGVLLNEAIDFIADYGSIPYHTPEIGCSEAVTNEMMKRAQACRISGSEFLFDYYDEEKIVSVKKALAEGKPVLVNILTYLFPRNVLAQNGYEPSFWYVKELWEPRPEELDERKSYRAGPHNVVVVSYDDNKYGGAFLIMNSYGTEWGDKGFFWMRYSDLMELGNAGYSIY